MSDSTTAAAKHRQWVWLGGALLGAGLSYLAYRLYQRSKTPKRVVRIGTRESKLAMWQAVHVRDRLAALHPDIEFEIKGMTTSGDQDLTNPLSNFTSKGVFTKELDVALARGAIDLAVHCMKDLPTTLPDGLAFAAVLERGDVEDALVVHPKHRAAGRLTLYALPAGAVVGTSALRRVAVLSKHFPKLTTKNVRGNVNTRLSKLDAGEYDALILAAVGLKRLGFADRIADTLNSAAFGYAVGQGALAVVAREGDAAHTALCAPLTHTPTLFACAAERGLLKELQGGCKVPIAVRSVVQRNDTATATASPTASATGSSGSNSSGGGGGGGGGGEGTFGLTVYGSVISLDGRRCVESKVSRADLQFTSASANGTAQQTAIVNAAHALGVELGEALRKAGAGAILAEIKG